MSSINNNYAAKVALATLSKVNNELTDTQGRISSGKKITSGKDNAAYFSISESMEGDKNTYNAINEGLTLTKNSISTARLGAEAFQELAEQFVERISFAQTGKQTVADVQKELDGIVKQMTTTIQQATFNGDDFVNAKGAAGVAAAVAAPDFTGGAGGDEFVAEAPTEISRDVVTGISRASGSFAATTMSIEQVDLTALLQDFANLAKDFDSATGAANTTAVNDAGGKQISTEGAEYLKNVLKAAEATFSKSVEASTSLGLSEKSIERQQEFLKSITDTIETGVSAMVDANMEEEAARLQALQVQQQLATQTLSIANEGPQNLLSLFR